MKYYFFYEDIVALKKKINEMSMKIRQLGKEQGEVVSQSTENFGHDDACQEVIENTRRMMMKRLNELRHILDNATVLTEQDLPNSVNSIRIGTVVKLSDECTFRIGSFMVLADYPLLNISYISPLAKALLGKKEGDKIEFRGELFEIIQIS
ncbi:GreA/GreB family elongation factor [bacterium]|nr:GreA/GreB family elongation factor [bacterium]